MNTNKLMRMFAYTTTPSDDLPAGDSTHLQILYSFITILRPNTCVELGSQEGHSGAWIAQALIDVGKGHLWCVDPFIAESCGLKRKPMFEKTMEDLNLNSVVTLVEEKSWDAVEKDLVPPSIDFLFIDGDHTKEGVLRDIDSYFPRLYSGSVVVFHDYHLSPGVKAAINKTDALKGFSQFVMPTASCGLYVAIKP